MAEINEIGVIDGIPSTGTGEVPTLAVIRDNLLTLIGHMDGVETLLTAIDGRVDGLEAQLTTANTHLDAIEIASESNANVAVVSGADEWETVAASQTDQMLGATGAAGDHLAAVLIIPATLSPGAVSIEDGSTNIVIFTGGTDSVKTLHPFRVDLGLTSQSGGWEITTGANVSVIGIGSFT